MTGVTQSEAGKEAKNAKSTGAERAAGEERDATHQPPATHDDNMLLLQRHPGAGTAALEETRPA